MTLLLVMVASEAFAAYCRSEPVNGVDWTGCEKRHLMLGGSDLQKANLYDADLSFTDLSGSTLQGADFERSTLIRASLAGAKADGANFQRIEAYRSDMTGLSGLNADFESAEMQRVTLSRANLAGANFKKAELSRALFDRAILTGVDFSFANLSRATLINARTDGGMNFTDSFLFRTRIEGLDLSTAKGLTQDQIDLACGDDKTILPADLKKPSAWPCPSD
ncbi:pentapeptide repeat-containing protein [Allorhizobium sp. BGMRC 0089]|uniref:pentapeptide repeat-containing protein n=1 Tax=Allorhizobium sonneratiae TaxID=2934936 RepID=UPI00203472C7|nr:pentapeptide repeat-containing protein [Allorhizobium sonneratiae]MCM2292742.1 pentapeptide repeat-containing protein [Allorhizobium sonneratiae]